ncbi:MULTISPECIES: PotD/PotF family extracellular solute-binding protein [unclassified Sphingopyxis]|jgi:spermidine/putrescine transport system substrate-binding protein|uniref:ABC transporter substrate-binding protein n=1 Tax=unclassified Sphingopyxis TaxID=2614943 RepID=UPI0006C2C498|nr:MULTISPECIES: spermidine/putrescine ABC transporter substrate-binding protein [unclassified Sphingopyxis]USI78834.1 spermidine/putrescine ABC transporter substrate-binding protein [Sphingopyxis sp. USTB-05]GAO78782.1 putrescine ABC transporter putrescine-binding protein PotF [Sphingopyxis sp. C-1]
MDPIELIKQTRGRRSLLQAMGVAAIGISFGGLAACSKGEGKKLANGEEAKLNFYNWDTYIGENTLDNFKETTGVDVTMDLFDSNDVLFAKFKAGNPGYDVIVPSNDFVERMSKAGMLMPLDHAQIPNKKNIDPAYINVEYDLQRKFSMPYTWLALGIGFRKSKVSARPDSWKVLFDSPEYAGRIAWLSEAGDMFRLYGKYLGKSVNALTPADIATIEKMMIKQKPNVKKFHEDDGQDLLLKGDVDVVLEYNGDIAQAMTEDNDIDFVVPKEGSQLNSDNLCIPKGAPHPKNAHAFINYILDANVDKEITETILYPTPNAAAKALMPDSYKNNPVIFPPAEVLAKCEYARFNPELQPLYEEAFTRVRAA